MILYIDVHSHASMHVPFNAGMVLSYLAAHEGQSIVVAADAGQCESLKQAIGPHDRVHYAPIPLSSVIRTPRSYFPLSSLRAAKACWRSIASVLEQYPGITRGVISGVDQGLLADIPKSWAKHTGLPMHYLHHNQLGTAMQWRSRNPYYRAFDFISRFSKPLPPRQTHIMLEIGMRDEVRKEVPQLKDCIGEIEHPILESEWSGSLDTPMNDPLNIGICGHCGRGKGFDRFVNLANQIPQSQLRFHAVGRQNPELADLDVSKLVRKPHPDGLDRETFLEAMAQLDLVSLFVPHTMRFVSSGSLQDALAALKPVIIPQNPMVRAITKRYGAFGPVVETVEEADKAIRQMSAKTVAPHYDDWRGVVAAIRLGRTPARIGQTLPD